METLRKIMEEKSRWGEKKRRILGIGNEGEG